MVKVKDVFSNQEIDGFYDSSAGKYAEVEIVKSYACFINSDGLIDSNRKKWPGKHKNVYNWYILANGKAIGFNENPSRGYSYPVITYTEKTI